MDWITVCAILHNFLINESEIMPICHWKNYAPLDIDMPQADTTSDTQSKVDAQFLRMNIMNNAIGVGRSQGGIVTFNKERSQNGSN